MEAPATSPGLRRLSAKQIAGIVESRPEDGHLVLSRIAPLLLSPSADVRACSAFCMQLAAMNMKIEPLTYCSEGAEMKLEDFDVGALLDDRAPLVATGGTEYDDVGLTAKLQRQNLRQVFSIAKGVDIDELTDEIVKEEDLSVSCDDTNKPSARERAMAKRKAKLSKNSAVKKTASEQKNPIKPISVDETEPLSRCAECLIGNLFSPLWHVRHGALIGLEAIFAGQGHSGRRECREALAVHLVSLLALDRFGDFDGDHMVAPVREAAASVLATIVSSDDLIDNVARALSALISYPHHWQVRHGGLVGMNKLEFNAVEPMSNLVRLSPALLHDEDDDVKSLTVQLLCRLIPMMRSDGDWGEIFEAALSLLERADDLSSSVSPTLQLLCLLSERGHKDRRLQSLLLPFFRSPLSSVRFQVLRTVKSLGGGLDEELKVQCLQGTLLESSREIRELAFELARASPPETARRYLPAIFTPLDCPYPAELFTFYYLGSSEPTCAVPEHELSFRAADVMVIDGDTVGRQRLSAAQALAGIFDELPGDFFKLSLSNVLITALSPRNVRHLDMDCSTRDRLFKCLFEDGDDYGSFLDLSTEYFASTDDLEYIVEYAAELVAERLRPKDILSFRLQGLSPGAHVIKVCRKLGNVNCNELLKKSSSPLQLLFVLLEARVASLEVCGCMAVIEKEMKRHPASDIATVFYSLFKQFPHDSIRFLLATLVPLLTSDDEQMRIVVGLCMERLVSQDSVATTIAPFAPLLLPPCLARMGDQSKQVRAIVLPLFASLLRIIPLDMTLPPGLEQFGDDLEQSKQFIASLSDPSKMLANLAVPTSIRAKLRPYQITGYSWMIFLQRYGLHGALCDDMGLGKTLQTLACLAYYYESTTNRGVKSLVICPSSLLGHWQHEASVYTPHLTTVVYVGTKNARRKLLERPCDILIVAYDVFRNDSEAFTSGKSQFAYLVLDEGHLVRNPKTKLWLAVREIRARHRLILTGTPIQNNVGELWALFDILMPGYLGDQKTFAERYGRPIQAASQANAGSLDFATAQKCLGMLHKQVLPFILRRMKEDVLRDLPPKIIQDYECELGEEQLLLYSELVERPARPDEGDTGLKDADDDERHMQKMAAFRKISIHPAVALEDPALPANLKQSVIELAKRMGRLRMDDIGLSPKLELLRDLIEGCSGYSPEDESSPNMVPTSPHKMLIFAQQKRTLDVIEEIVLKANFSQLSWLRLDGDTPSAHRNSLALKFNRDPSIPLLLLTTKVGGLGLNLTGADTVVFVEHDWNPMADLQAMDRAHRLGQQRVVNVYRLITRDTVEERIMGLQRWKQRVASAVVNQQNASMQTMETAGLLELLGGSGDD